MNNSGNYVNENMIDGIMIDGQSIKDSERQDETVLAANTSHGGTKMSRVTMLTDKWRALNADLFDYKLRKEIRKKDTEQTCAAVTNNNAQLMMVQNNRIGVLQNINPSR